jgi:hypothetical protein
MGFMKIAGAQVIGNGRESRGSFFILLPLMAFM